MALTKNFFFLAGGIFLADRVFKTIFQKVSVDLGFLNLHLVKNTGGFWGLFQGMNMLFIIITLIVLFGILFFLHRILASPKIIWVSFALIFAGGLGNLTDRISVGYVIDFIDFKFWPAFNIADSAITVAIVLLLIHEFKPFFSKLIVKRKRLNERKV